jgi:hypothetical protein
VLFKKNYLKNIIFSSFILFFIVLPPPIVAANEALLELLKVLRDKGTLSPQEYELLVEASKEDNEKIKESIDEMKAEVKKTKKDSFKITTKGKFKVASQDGSWEWQPIGRIFWDTVFADRDNSNLEATNSELRRARLGFRVKLNHWVINLRLILQTQGQQVGRISGFHIIIKMIWANGFLRLVNIMCHSAMQQSVVVNISH